MRWVWAGAVVLSLAIVGAAHADTIYLKDGRVIWGKDVVEEGDQVILIRPDGSLTFSRSQVDRVERVKNSLPRFYSVPPPEAPSAAPPAGPAPAPPGSAPPPGGAPGTPAPASGGGGAAPSPTELPPVPPPPSPQQ
jgi:hypothetical protein